MRRETNRRRGAAKGFTLVELLVVMGIIGVLVGLLMPAVNRAIVAVHVAATKNIVHQLGLGLESFRGDFNTYPPSGAANLAQYLPGPNGHGWGAGAEGNAMPFGGTSTEPYGPYFTPKRFQSGMGHISDTFRPAKAILYFRYKVFERVNYNVEDNPTDGAASEGFRDQQHFELLVKPRDPAGVPRYVRTDYLLISPGPDRFYGYMYQNPKEDYPKPATSGDMDRFCDDITNFKF